MNQVLWEGLRTNGGVGGKVFLVGRGKDGSDPDRRRPEVSPVLNPFVRVGKFDGCHTRPVTGQCYPGFYVSPQTDPLDATVNLDVRAEPDGGQKRRVGEFVVTVGGRNSPPPYTYGVSGFTGKTPTL